MRRTARTLIVATVAIAALTQCSKAEQGVPVGATPAAPSTDDVVIAAADVEAWLGDWAGPVEQTGFPPYEVRINLSHDGQTVLGTVEYPDLACSGRLDDAALADGVLSVVENITVNDGNCLPTVDLELTLRPGEIGYRFDSTGGGDGVLYRPTA